MDLYYLILLNLTFFTWAEHCHDDPVKLDEQFIGCCHGRPKYISESCIDTLLANDTFSQECLLDCMYREFKIYDGSEIDLAAVKTFLDKEITDEAFNLMYLKAFERCSKLNKEAIHDKLNFIELRNTHNCDDYSLLIDICVWYHTLAHCPESHANQDESCHEKQEWVNECLLHA